MNEDSAATTSQFRSSQLTWTGDVDNDWGTAGNWTIDEGPWYARTPTNRAPRSIDNVLIPAGLGTYPTISAGTVNAREIVIADGATLNMTGGTLNIGWRWQDSGGFNGTGGTVVFDGPIDIGITSGSGSTFFNVMIGDGTSTMTAKAESDLDINGDVTIRKQAIFQGGSHTINVAGNWTENATSTETGFLPGTSTVIFDGNVQTIGTFVLIDEPFDEADGKTNYSTGNLPPGWKQQGLWVAGEIAGKCNAGMTAFWWADGPGWLMTEPVTLSSDVTYELSYNYQSYDGSETTWQIWLATEQDFATKTTQVSTVTSSSTDCSQSQSDTFTVDTAGTYYLAIYGYGRPVIDNILLTTTGIRNPTFYNMGVSSTGGATAGKDLVVNNNLTVDSGSELNLAGYNATVDGVVTNNGSIQQQKDVPNASTTEFLHIQNVAGTADKYWGVALTPSGDMGATTVEIRGNQTCGSDGDLGNAIKRCYEIDPSTDQTAVGRFYYRSAEANGNSATQVWHHTSGTSWEQETFGGRGGSGDGLWVDATGIDNYSPFTLKDTAPNGDPTKTAVQQANLGIVKSVTPETAAPGEAITYTLTFSNAGSATATGVVITDSIPVSVTHSSLNVSSSGAAITATGSISYVWDVADLGSGQGGIITITGVLSSPLASDTFTTTAVDGDSSNNSSSAGVTVQNQAPVADAGADQSVATDALVTLDGSGSSDPDGNTPLSYGWQQTGGTGVTLSNATAESPTFTAPGDPTVLTFSLTVTDSLGLADAMPDQVVVTVTNQAPVADAGTDQTVDTNALVTLDGSGSSDPDDDMPLTYGWQQTGGTAVTLSDATAESPTFTAPGDPTVLTFSLTVTDALGLADATPDQVVITVTTPSVDLQISKAVTPGAADPGQPITYTLAFTNAGPDTATGVVITDAVPVSVTHSSLNVSSSGAAITATGSISYVWDVADLGVGQGGVITITGQLSAALATGTFTNTATITTTAVDDDTTDNSATASITVCYDLNGDGQVDIEDIMLVASHWRCRCGDGCYDPDYDIDDDCDIDVVDIMLVVVHWGETCS